KVLATAGNLSITAGPVVASTLNAAGIPQVGTIAGTSQELSNPDVYLLDAGTLGSMLAMVRSANDAGLKKVALVRLDSPATQLIDTTFKSMLPRFGSTYTGAFAVPSSATDLASVAQQVKTSGADFVAVVAATKEIPLLRAAKQLGVTAHFGFTDGAFTPQQISDNKDLLEGVTLASPVPPLTAADKF